MFCVAVLLGVIVIRLVWVGAGPALPVPTDAGTRPGYVPPWSHTVVIGWAGMRGVVTLAAAFLIPEDVAEVDC